MSSPLRKCVLVVAILGGLVVGCRRESQPEAANAPERAKDQPAETSKYEVTPVTSPSWLRHLGLDVSQTQMGQMGGTQPAPASARSEPDLAAEASGNHSSLGSMMRRYLSVFRSNPGEASKILHEQFVLTGADLYRLNCQSCHGPDGQGAPPEINSLLGPVQGSSAAAIVKRMKARGTPIGDDMAKQMAQQAGADLRNRLKKGGEKMPPFDHLRGDEVEALLGYLDRLSGVPAGSRGTMRVSESAERVGEHLVKGTCHICHDATGPGGGHMAMMQGIIPSLASMPRDNSLSTVLQQVHYGSSGMMGMMGGPRMPAYPYITDDEAAAAYFYLADDPPRP
jgi:mono/diheme cytochrome c family protein